MRSREYHHHRAAQESRMKGQAVGPAILLHETMLFYHLEQCHAAIESDRFCVTCSLKSVCDRHHHNLDRGTTVWVVDLVATAASTD